MKKALKALLLAALAVVIIFPALNCKKEPDQISVRLKWIYSAGFAGDIIALEKGIFEKNGLNVTLHEGGFNLDPIKLVASGSDQIGIDGSDKVMLARAQGLPLVCIGVIFQSSPVVFLSKEDSGIKTPQDFVGHKVGTKPGTDVMTIYQAMLAHEGIDRSEIKEIPIQFSLTPFVEDQIDVHPTYVTNEPFTLDKMGVKYNVIDPKTYGVDIYGMCYFTTEQMIKEHPDVVQRYLKSVMEAYAWALENKDEAAKILKDFSDKMDLEVERKYLGAMEPLLKNAPEGRIGWMEKEKWEASQQIYLNLDILAKPINIDSLYTNRFLEKIYK